MGDDDQVRNVQPAHLEKREGVADDGADIRLKVRPPVTGVHSGRPPDLHGQGPEAAEEGPGIMDGEILT